MSREDETKSLTSRAGFLSEIDDHNRFLRTVHAPDPEDLDTIRHVLGSEFTQHLARLHAPLYVFNGLSNLGTRGFQDEERGSHTILPIHKYVRTDFATIMDGWVVFINTWKARKAVNNKPSKAARFDFMLLEDWMNQDDFNTANTRLLEADARANGMFTRGSGLIRKLQRLMVSVPEDCRIDVHSANAQREKVYRKLFANRPNIIVFQNDEDAASPLRKLMRRVHKFLT